MKPPTSAPGQHAPAVARAMRAVERLAADDEPCSLSALSRELGIGPSSLLTILAPLRESGVVVRGDGGRYALGPALVGLGEAAARACSDVRLFERIAGPLAEQTGETCLLWSACGDGFVLAAAREGRHALRFVPSIGQRLVDTWPRTGVLAGVERLTEDELVAGVWMVAAPLPTVDGVVRSIIAVAGPTMRLRGRAGETARVALRDAVASLVSGARAFDGSPGRPGQPAADVWPRGVGVAASTVRTLPHGGTISPVTPGPGPTEPTPAATDWERAGPIEGDELDAFLRQSLVATLSYVADDGYPATVPLWYAWDGAAFWLAPRPGAEWAAHVRLDPRVSLAVSESAPPLRRVLARGRLVAVDDPDAGQVRHVSADLAARYAGCGAARPGEVPGGPLLRLLPGRLIAWRGLLRHPRVASDASDGPDLATRRQHG